MSTADVDPKPDDTPTAPDTLATGQRTLAAIVFTDTVGFSALMRKDEERALRLVARDLERMKETCTSFGGQVLKNTGDGYLVLFTSAVQAVACALEIQRNFRQLSLELPKDERLEHRIGIHLGDVFQSGGDVMGDGVNIAARLQTEAVPGGICLSKTVYDVVANRLQFYVNDLGARKLKNIGTVTAYQISPVESGSKWRAQWYRWRSMLPRTLTMVLVLAVILAFWIGVHREHAAHNPATFTIIPVTPQPRKPTSALATPAPAPEPVSPVASPVPARVEPEGVTEVSDQEFEMARFDYMRNYDFEGMMDWIAVHDWPGKSASTLSQKCHDMQHLFRWTQERLHGYSATHPLVVTSPGGKKTEFWTVSFGGLRMRTGSQTINVLREQIPPAMMRQIVVELLSEQTLPAGERAHFKGDLAVFTEFYHLETPGKQPPSP